MYLHKEGIDEPNKEHVWAANAITTLDFKAVKGAIVLLFPYAKNKVMNSGAGTKGTVGTPQ